MRSTLLEFLTCGRLGALEIGQSPEEVSATLGAPSDVSTSRHPLIWQFGSLELAFESERDSNVDRLTLIALYFRDGSRRLPGALELQG